MTCFFPPSELDSLIAAQDRSNAKTLRVVLDRAAAETKARPSLLPGLALIEAAALMTAEQKAKGDGWKAIPAADHVDAALRHALRWTAGVTEDDDSGRSHLVHAVVRLLMAVDRELNESEAPS